MRVQTPFSSRGRCSCSVHTFCELAHTIPSSMDDASSNASSNATPMPVAKKPRVEPRGLDSCRITAAYLDNELLKAKLEKTMRQTGTKNGSRWTEKNMPRYNGMLGTWTVTQQTGCIIDTYVRRRPSSTSMDGNMEEELYVSLRIDDDQGTTNILDVPACEMDIPEHVKVGERVNLCIGSEPLGMPMAAPLPHTKFRRGQVMAVTVIEKSTIVPHLWRVEMEYRPHVHLDNTSFVEKGQKPINRKDWYPSYYLKQLKPDEYPKNEWPVRLTKAQSKIWFQKLFGLVGATAREHFNFDLQHFSYFGLQTIMENYEYNPKTVPLSHISWREPFCPLRTAPTPYELSAIKEPRSYPHLRQTKFYLQEWRLPLKQLRLIESALRAGMWIDDECVQGISAETNEDTGLLQFTHEIYEGNSVKIQKLIMDKYATVETQKGSVVEALSAAYQELANQLRKLMHVVMPALTEFIRKMLLTNDPDLMAIRYALEDALYGNERPYSSACHVGPLASVTFGKNRVPIISYPLQAPIGHDAHEHVKNRQGREPLNAGVAPSAVYSIPE